MRPRDRILENLEEMYREAYSRAQGEDAEDEMAELDFEFQRDQLFLEALLDIRNLLAEHPAGAPADPAAEEEKEESLLDKAEKLRRIARLR